MIEAGGGSPHFSTNNANCNHELRVIQRKLFSFCPEMRLIEIFRLARLKLQETIQRIARLLDSTASTRAQAEGSSPKSG